MTTLVLGPSIGTSADSCWGAAATLLRDEFEVVAWELPGHGTDRGPVPDGLTIEDLAARVLAQVDGPFLYAGDSVGAPGRTAAGCSTPRTACSVPCSAAPAAKIGDDAGWRERIAQVRASGTASLVSGSVQRWFAPGFVEREPDRVSALMHALRDTSDDGYVAVCGALAAYDVRDRLGEIAAPVVAVAGGADPVCSPDMLREIADGVQQGRLVVLDDVGHQAPAEAPEEVAMIIRELAKEVL